MEKAPEKKPAASVATKRKKSRKSQKPPEAPKRFKSAFIFFSSAKHPEIREKLAKEGSTEKVTSVAKIVSEQWKNLPPDERKEWDELARKDKERYEAEKQTYKGPWKIASKDSYKKDPNAPKRPMSAFFAWSNRKRGAMKKSDPSLKNGDISKLLSVAWKNAPKEEKQKFVDEEVAKRDEYKKNLECWNKKKQEENRKKLREEALNKKRSLQKAQQQKAAEEKKILEEAEEKKASSQQVQRALASPESTQPKADTTGALPSIINSSVASANPNLVQAAAQQMQQNQQQQLFQNALTLSALGGQANAAAALARNPLFTAAPGTFTTQPQIAVLPQTASMFNMPGGGLTLPNGLNALWIPSVQAGSAVVPMAPALTQFDALNTQQLLLQQLAGSQQGNNTLQQVESLQRLQALLLQQQQQQGADN
mmetsp:Transcript_16743/g.23644  ORF Transcript_16743/g.23644 Transcript_16743/m.23644 type:complete len:423 (-) Transcript_16743:159-1427(-)